MLCFLTINVDSNCELQEDVLELFFVSQCLPYVDASTLGELISKVLELMRSSVGMGTRVACAHLIVLLTYHLKQELQPYTGTPVLLHTLYMVQQFDLVLYTGHCLCMYVCMYV